MSSDELNFQPRRVEGLAGQEARNTEAALAHIRETLDVANTNLIRIQRRSERTEKQAESLSRQVMALWILLFMVIVGVGLLSWYQILLQRKP